jgi:hypothetical protein
MKRSESFANSSFPQSLSSLRAQIGTPPLPPAAGHPRSTVLLPEHASGLASGAISSAESNASEKIFR